VIGLIAVAKGGLSGPITDPVVDVAGFSHTPLLGLIEAGVGLVLLACALWGSRASGVFMGTVIAVAGVVVAATPSSFADTLATEASYGWFLVVLGAVVAVACLAIPDRRSSRTVVYN
jgi:peptidoglycan/LPS O-acetylase OafA/YrhL